MVDKEGLGLPVVDRDHDLRAHALDEPPHLQLVLPGRHDGKQKDGGTGETIESARKGIARVEDHVVDEERGVGWWFAAENGRVKGSYCGDPEISDGSLTLFKERCPNVGGCQFSGSRFVGEKLRLWICVKDFSKGASVQVIRMPMTEKDRGKILELAGLDKTFDEAKLTWVKEDA
jgi:hypothetical protein